MWIKQSWLFIGLLGLINAAEYCMNTGPTSDLDTTLGEVSITGDSGSGFTADKYCGEGLRDLTGTYSVELVIGASYSISWGGDTCGSNFPKEGRIWVDWDIDGWAPGDSYEKDAITPVEFDSGAFTRTSPFSVPGSAKAGISRMRAMVIEDSDPNALEPCHHFAFGGTTDFKVEIITTSGGGSSGGGSGGGGTIFLIVLLVLVILYCALGFAYNFKKLGKQGLDAVPNIEFWKEFPSYVKDGCTFTMNKIKGLRKGKNGGYSTFEDV